jgi:hypothetical protein
MPKCDIQLCCIDDPQIKRTWRSPTKAHLNVILSRARAVIETFGVDLTAQWQTKRALEEIGGVRWLGLTSSRSHMLQQRHVDAPGELHVRNSSMSHCDQFSTNYRNVL